MLGWVVIFAIVAMIAGSLEFFAPAGLVALFAKIALAVSLLSLALSFLARFTRGAASYATTGGPPSVAAARRFVLV